MPNIDNLKPFTGADDPHRQNGRKKGSKNLSTIVAELLESDVESPNLLNGEIGKYLNNSPTTYAKAIAMAMIVKAINGDVRAADWVTSLANKAPTKDGFFEETNLIFNVVPNRTTDKHF